MGPKHCPETSQKSTDLILMTFCKSLEIFIRFSKKSLLLCCVAKCKNGTEIAEDTQKTALFS
jgi:hypothetical protein